MGDLEKQVVVPAPGEVKPVAPAPELALPVVRRVTTAAERAAVFELRYRVYVELMRRPQKWADHGQRSIEEPLDRSARLIGAFTDERAVGTCRVNVSKDTELHKENGIWRAEAFEQLYPQGVSLATKMMVEPVYRRSGLFLQLCREVVRVSIQGGASVILADCNEGVRQLFENMGFIRYRAARHEEYGDVVLLALFLEDRNHLARLDSPLLEPRDELWKGPSV